MKKFKEIRTILESEDNSHLPKHRYSIGQTVQHSEVHTSHHGLKSSGKITDLHHVRGEPAYDIDDSHWVLEKQIHRAHK